MRSISAGAVAVLIAVAVALYWGSLGYPLVFDDKRMVGALPGMLEAGFGLERRGIAFGSFGWIYGALGPDWRWQRLANVVLHAAVGVVLFLFLRRLFDRVAAGGRAGEWTAFFGALLFVMHPAAVYGVAYLTQRSIVLATLFSLVSLWLFLEGLARRAWPWFVGAALAYLLAVFSKEHCVMLPAVAAALAVLVRGWPPRPLGHLVLAFALYAAIGIAVIVQQRWLIGGTYESLAPAALKQAAEAGVAGSGPGHPYAASLVNQGYLFFRYVLTWLLPWPGWMSIDLRPAFPAGVLAWPQSAGFLAWLAWPALGAVLVLRGGRAGLAGLALLAPWLLALTEFSTARVQEPFVLYRSYLWMCLLPAALPAVFVRLRGRLALALGAAALVALVFPFFERLRTFSSELALWDDAVRKIADPRAPFTDRAYRNRGVAYFHAGQDAEALRDFDRAIELHPGTPEGWISRGTLFMRAAQSERARADFSRALELDPANGEVRARRCIVHMRLGRLDEALADCTRALELAPADASVHVVLGMAQALRGEPGLAEKSYLRALELGSPDGSAHYQYGVLLRGTGRAEEARRQFGAACRAGVEAACRAVP